MQTSQERPMTTFRVADSAPPGSASHDSSAQPASPSQPRSLEGRMLHALLHAFGDPPVQFALWNGERLGAAEPVATLHIPDRSTLVRLCRDPDLQFGELYSIGKIPVEGDIGRLIEVLY